jgi:hypothetical protein
MPTIERVMELPETMLPSQRIERRPRTVDLAAGQEARVGVDGRSGL